jgi:predicted flap endonuclease-1-like 5' DNA nuclease
MRRTENRNAPNLWGWAIAAAAGLVAFGVLLVVGKFDLFPAAAMSGGVALVAGLILGMPSRPLPVRGVTVVATPAPAPAAKAPVTEAAPAAFVSAPAPAAGAGPARLTGPRGGKADDLKEIEGIGPAMEKLVNEMGFYHFDQIASWSEADVAVVDAEMKSFKGRITRDKWVAQAKIIVTEGLPAFRERIKTNNY